MAALTKIVQGSKTINNVTKLFTNLSLSSAVNPISNLTYIQRLPTFHCSLFHTTSKQNGLMEFFDEVKNWDQKDVKVGRSWKKDELRLKSNEDLHKLWFVLLKERNMLLTMEEACKRKWTIFPNPERIDKVAISMDNLEAVVRERNEAYFMLETGRTGERPIQHKYNPLGLRFKYRLRQHRIPQFMNTKWRKTHKFSYGGYAVAKFLRLYREKLWLQKRRLRTTQNNKVAVLMRTFPNLDLKTVRKQYPYANIKKLEQSHKTDGHFVKE